MNYIKGPDLLIKAFEEIADKIPKYNLLIAGNDDGMEHLLREKAKNLNMKKEYFWALLMIIKKIFYTVMPNY